LFVLLMGFLSFGFIVLALINFTSIFALWKRYKMQAFIPLATLVISIVASFFIGGFGSDLLLRNTPCRPDSFFNSQAKAVLTDAAEHLVGNGFEYVILYPDPDKPLIQMMPGHPTKEVNPKILAVMSKYGFVRADIDDSKEIVKFGYSLHRISYDYIWAKNGLSEPEQFLFKKKLGDNWYFNRS